MQPVIEFGILVVAEALVIAADGAKSRNAHEGVMAVVGPVALGAVPMRRAAIAEPEFWAMAVAFWKAPKPSVAIDTTTESAPVDSRPRPTGRNSRPDSRHARRCG